ncbi:hypothetical protein OG895_36300 [Streptomyces sp. NBC_00201]|uniref:hypothetical protein n=1 Tax=unclassified Streptomyces TaxID=2593676 RepID=UPI00225547F2|nr:MULTISPECIES: hypothetical protein [unclassified Streptomyces]MCX5250602.1 hypothetical protein [Streptomyces sp. NBC_00201]MCX5291469.1 hypothetical protein [Streptomyces sp. NBC_00183]
MTAVVTRSEHDLLGDRDVPADAYWGIHTLRATENFPITGTPADERIDGLQRDLEDRAIAVPARQQPVATDLRVVVTSLRMSADRNVHLARPALPVTRQAVAKHLAVLDRACRVRGLRTGREVRHEAHLKPLERTAHWLNALAAQWDRRLDAIKDLAEQEEPS